MTARRGYFYAAIANIGWGSMFVATKIAYQVITPWDILFLRYLIGAIALFLVYRHQPRKPVQREDYGAIAFIGIFGYFFSIALQMISIKLISSSLASIINTLAPVVVMILAIPILHEVSTREKNASIVVTVIGAVIVIGGSGSGNSPVGIAICFGGMGAWALTSVMIRKTCSNYDGIWLTIYTQVIACVCSAPLAFYDMAKNGLGGQIRPVHIAAILFVGVISTAGANLWWTKALEINDANTSSLFYAVMPLTASILGILIFHESITPNFIAGSLVIIAGMMLAAFSEVIRQKRREFLERIIGVRPVPLQRASDDGPDRDPR